MVSHFDGVPIHVVHRLSVQRSFRKSSCRRPEFTGCADGDSDGAACSLDATLSSLPEIVAEIAAPGACGLVGHRFDSIERRCGSHVATNVFSRRPIAADCIRSASKGRRARREDAIAHTGKKAKPIKIAFGFGERPLDWRGGHYLLGICDCTNRRISS